MNSLRIMSIDMGNHVPTISFKTLRGVIAEPGIYFAVD